MLSGCASEGPLRPPSLHLPSHVEGLFAERVGGTVRLRWTNPTKATDGTTLAGKHVPLPLQVEVCRVAGSPEACLPPHAIRSTAGTSTETFNDDLPAALATGSIRLLRYRVRVLNGAGKGAAFSTVDALAGAAPPPLANINAAPTANGVLIRWQPVAAAASGRILIRVKRGSSMPEEPGTIRTETSTPPRGTSPRSKGNRAFALNAPEEVSLAVEDAAADRGGALDTGAKRGTSQQYFVARTRTVSLGGKDLVISGPVATVSIAAGARLPPPDPPRGLESLANTLGAPEIDLVWQPSATATAYQVFRAEGTGSAVLLTPDAVPALSYADRAVHLGVRYRYSISGVNADGTAGPRGPEISEEIPGPVIP